MMKKTYLLTPGPTPIPEAVLSEFAKPILHHRSAEFSEILTKVSERLKKVFHTKQHVLTIASTGTGAMEATVLNCFSRGDKVITVESGKFGERWTELANTFGLKPIVLEVEWGKAVDPALIEKTLKENSDAKGILIQASETSTGVRHPIEEICKVKNNYEQCLLCVDGITGVGAFPLLMDDWGIDVLLSGSQKAFMLPPGLAMIALSEKAWKAAEKSDIPKYYFDLRKELKAATKKNTTSYTPAVSLIVGLNKVLKMMETEGLDNVYKRHEICSRAAREGVKALGLELLAPEAPSASVTAVKVPDGLDGKALVKTIKTKYGVWLAGGQGKLEGKIFRIASLGYMGQFDIITGLSAIGMALKEHGHSCNPEAGVSVAQKIFSEDPDAATPALGSAPDGN